MADDSADLQQDEIDSLLSGMGDGSAGKAADQADEAEGESTAAASEVQQPSSEASDADVKSSGDIDLLLQQAQAALDSVDQPAGDAPENLSAFELKDFAGSPASTEQATIDLIRDVELDLKIELGRSSMCLEDVLGLRKGSVVPLDKLAGDPVDVYANGRLIARGEVLVLNDNFCVRVAELVTGDAAG